jgi:hypothetical protein
MLAAVEQQKGLPVEEAAPKLGLWMRQLSRSGPQSPDERTVFLNTQAALLSLSGHSQYFADQVAAARESTKDFVADCDYHITCETLRDTLCHLPSPETVQVLGEMLESMEDIPTRDQIVELRKAVFKGADFKWFYPSGLAGQTLLDLGIRGFPSGSGRDGGFSRADVSSMRFWWEEIESGIKSLSFKGQDVEYRFKPDGTWETIPISNPPDDGPSRPVLADAKRTDKRPDPVAVEQDPNPAWNENSWIWIGGATAALAGLFALFFLHRRKSGA